MKVTAIRNNILFEFLDDTRQSDGKFVERNRGIIMLGTIQANQNSAPRWGRALSVGPEVYGVQVGDFILVEAGKWTVGTEIDGQKMWKTDDQWVICTTDAESDTFGY